MRIEPCSGVHCDPEVSRSTPVFRGTRVPVHSLFDYLEGGETIEQFLNQFPSVSKEQPLAPLDLAATPFRPVRNLLDESLPRFDALLTMDRGHQFQQNVSRPGVRIAVVHVRSHRMAHPSPMIGCVLMALDGLAPGNVREVGA